MNIQSDDLIVAMEENRGFPVKCRCGRNTIMKTSETKQNPGRPFFRCPTFRDDHLFKWVEEVVYEEVEDALPKVEYFESEIMKTRADIEGVKSVNEELMEEVVTAKNELKRLNLCMKVGFGFVCLIFIICVVLILVEKPSG